MDDANALGNYLKARRELVQPEDVGIRTGTAASGGGTRRVAGLRREEVAMLAGVSADYYLRLEQGRDRNPSVQVLQALARVLHLAATPPPTCSPCPNPQRRRPVRAGRSSPPAYGSSWT